ncbi:hypothetical protein [Clostridium cochlearium]|mgnify:CR=1 FL=1|uniref:tRNA (Guanine37-N1)-methyltransferase n=1 Tax=Clostridium cochlearium TaxID=1494 RepID=A0A240AW23_CLOCO|nr:hypothetical protein [Clostridium cochlearium]MBV1819407.1 hypothetical protein [Bacteroidales bacterium MSK.15.36]NSJ91488.1 hypothetical protein [Coprococcus sp. MSK.21.13]MBE6065858.1 hypothetical protein [Clostridium cochlearium]MBU5268636.1 hypothetical protein [Clostridium cochlearium]MCG4571637.1 hypothetical protein [Clostridium cochlearium]
MRKPSIFSSDYEKQMKKRRIRIIALILAGIVVCSGAWLLGKKKLESMKKGNNKVIDNIDDNKDYNKLKDEKIIKEDIENKDTGNKDKKSEKGYEVTLSNGEKLKLMYEEDGEKKFKYILPLESKVNYDISPNGKNILIYDDKVQKIICYDINGKEKNVTNEKYISTNGSVVIERESHIKSNPDYIWCREPKFIDDNNIAYISQLPWLGKTNKYIWITNIEQNTHFYVASIEAGDIKMDKITDKGLLVIIDGKNMYLSANGVLTE